MMKFIPPKVAALTLMTCLVFLMLFHLLVALGILPGDIVWGGTMEGDAVVKYELAAFFITGFLLFIAIIKGGYVPSRFLKIAGNILIWPMLLYFAFMIFGNLTAKSVIEKAIFIPLSALMFLSSLPLALNPTR